MEQVPITTSAPKAWEREDSFHESFYEWMDRSPWVAISAGLHFVAYFLLLAIPWHMFERVKEKEITASFLPEVQQEDPPPPIPPETLQDIPIDFVDVPIDPVDVPNVVESTQDSIPEGDPDQRSDDPFEKPYDHAIIGAAGGPGGTFGERGDGRKKLSGGGDLRTAIIIEQGLNWLRDHQSEDGYWDVDEYHRNNLSGRSGCTQGAGIAAQDIGITGLALLAFLGDGSSTAGGPYQASVQRGIRWLMEHQDEDSGLIGEAIGHGFVYDHAIATLALTESYHASKNPFQKRAAQRALNYISRARSPYGGWRYEVPSDGETDTSITGWMIFALKAGADAGLTIDREAFASTLQYLDSVTDESTGRVSYIGPERGGRSSRTQQNEHFDPALSEAMTGVGLLTRTFLGQTPDSAPIMKRHGDLMLRTLPQWDKAGQHVDMYYWYYATYAMYQLGGEHWRKWKKAMNGAILPNQREDGDYLGSWDPIGPWGYQGGRVYATATMVLTLEVYYRYSRLTGAK